MGFSKQRHYLVDQGPNSRSYGLSSSHVWMWELAYKEGWASKNWYFQTVVLEKTLKSPLDCKEMKPVNSKGNQPWIFTGRSDAPKLWPPDVKSQLTSKGPVAGKDWGQEEKGVHGITDSMDMSLSKLPGDSEGQGSLAFCSSWGCKELDTTEWLNWTELNGPVRC